MLNRMRGGGGVDPANGGMRQDMDRRWAVIRWPVFHGDHGSFSARLLNRLTDGYQTDQKDCFDREHPMHGL